MSESLSENDGDGEVVLARERQVIEDVLSAAIDPKLLPAEAGRFLQKLSGLGDSLPAALAASLRHPEPKCRVLAAWMFLKIWEKATAGTPRKSALELARKVILDALRQDDYELRAFACIHLSGGGIPSEAIPVLVELVDQSDAVLSVYSAAALTLCGEAAVRSIPVLTKGLCLEDEVLASVAANALARLEVRKEEATAALVRRLKEAPSSHQFSVIVALRDIGEPAKAAAPALARIAGNSKLTSLVRAAAADALGSVCPNDASVRNRLEKLLNPNNWEVSEGALRGLSWSAGVSKLTLARLRDFLNSDDCDVRRTAARGVEALGTRAEPILEELIGALCRETDRDLLLELARSCAALGRLAVKPLCCVIQTGEMNRFGGIVLALILLGRDAAEGIAVSLLNHVDDVVRWTCVSILRSLGPNSEPAIPALTALLPELIDERAIYVLLMFGKWGQAAVASIPAIVDCLLERRGQIAEIAGNVLVSMGNSAVPHLEQSLRNATEDGRRRIQQVLARIRPTVQRTFEKLLTLNADKDLLLFVVVGTVMENARVMGLRKIGRKLESLEPVKLMGLPTSEAAIREMLGELSSRLKVSLTQTTTRGSLLTDEGRDLLAEAREYLPWRGYSLVGTNRVD
jgi:hypothetical protein